MNLPANPQDAKLPGPPTCSKDYQTDDRVHCIREWMYVMCLLQYWHDAGSVYTYGGPIRQESKLMLYVFYRINAMLNPYSIFIWLHEVMNNTPWLSYYQAHTLPEQCIADYESHLHVIKGLEILQNWLRNRYLVEATAEWRHLQLHGGSLDRLPFPHSYEDQQSSNEGPFYCSRGICPNEVKPTLENAPCVANAMLEVLACHNHRQSKARDCQEYQQQQDNTESPITNFPLPTPVDQDKPMDLGGLEGATTAPSPFSSTTMVPPLSSSAVPVPAKKKISIQEYNRHKAAEQQRVSTYLNRDDNGEDLDYEDFELQDNPANIQISYRTPTPILQIPDLPPLQDASSPVSQSAATLVAPNVPIPMPQGNTSPGTVPGTTVHNVATVANWAPGFGRGLPVARASPMQVRTPAASASPMQVSMPVASPHRTPGYEFTTEETLLQGATLPCSPWQEANLLNPPVTLMDNHIKMMDALRHLDSYSLQFICESAEALCRERMPTQAPPGYCTLQTLDAPWGSINNPPLSQEFYMATSNLSTAIVEPRQVLPQQRPAGSQCPDPEIESAVTNMQRHEQVLSMLPTDSNNNPWWGCGPCHPSLHTTWSTLETTAICPYGYPWEFRRLKIQDSRPLLIHRISIPYAFVSLYFYYFDFCILVLHVFFSGYHVNTFALCSRPYHYVSMICFRFSRICVLYIYHSRLPYVVVYALSVSYSVMHCIIIPGTVSRIIFIVFNSLSFNISGVTISRVICWQHIVRMPAVCS